MKNLPEVLFPVEDKSNSLPASPSCFSSDVPWGTIARDFANAESL